MLCPVSLVHFVQHPIELNGQVEERPHEALGVQTLNE